MKKFLMFAIAAVISNTSFAASYVIQPGDTLLEVAYNYGVSYNELMEANPGIDPEYIKYGFRIEIPERKVVTTASRTVIRIENPVPKHNSQNPVPKHNSQNPVPKHNSPQPQPQPYAMQHTTPTGLTTITVVEDDTVY